MNDLFLQKFSKLSVADILGLKIKGIGKIKAVRILAAIELGSRRMYNSIDKKNIRQSKDVADHLKYLLQFESRELFMVLLLNQANKVIHEEILNPGWLIHVHKNNNQFPSFFQTSCDCG